MGTPDSVPNLRRNGKRPSCEPCRKSKLSCDHVMPICGRCQRRKIPDKCTYHPAPMTGLKPALDKDKRASIRHRSASPRRGSSSDFSQPRQSVLPAPGFLGSTSYSAVFAESQGQIDLSTDLDLFCPTKLHDHERKVRKGRAIISFLKDFPHFEALALRWREITCDIALTALHLRDAIQSIREELYEPYVKNGSDDDLLIASRILFDAFGRLIKVTPGCTISEYASQFTGKNVRWETLGMLFTAAGLGVMQLNTDDALLDFVGHGADDKRALCRKMLNASNNCIDFCDDAGHLSDPNVWLLNENLVLMSQVLGDANYLTWRRLGDLSTAVFALGLHQEIKVSQDIPFWLVEYRRRALAVTYGVDKLICTFVGRPPRISKRYCAIEPPLDLDFDDLRIEDENELAKKISQLEPDGWNRNPLRSHTTYHARAFLFMSQIREEILELSLGPHLDDTFEIAADIARRNKEVWDALPQDVKYHPDIWSSDKARDDCVVITVVYLDIVYNDFMLQRTLVRRIRARSDEVIRISRLLVTTLIDMLSNHGRSTSVTSDDPWMIVLYGLPAAGVLALELLQQSQRTTAPRSQESFPRSEIIQNLSVFVSYLGWVHVEGDGNYHLCMQARRMLQRILDKVLSPQLHQSVLTKPPQYALDEPFGHSQMQGATALPTPTNSDQFTPDGLLDFSWMDNWNAEFEADFWMNLPDHPLLALDGSAI